MYERHSSLNPDLNSIDTDLKAKKRKAAIERRRNEEQLYFERRKTEIIERNSFIKGVYGKLCPQINYEQFRGLQGYNIEAETEKLEKVKSNFEADPFRESSDSFEYIYGVHTQMFVPIDKKVRPGWFCLEKGLSTFSVRAAEPDDIFNHTDIIQKSVVQNPEVFGLSEKETVEYVIDCTSSTKMIIEKLERALIENYSIEGHSLKYHSDPQTKEKGTLENVPIFIVGVDHQHKMRLIEEVGAYLKLMVKKDKSQEDQKKLAELEKRIQNQPLQLVFMEEIRLQAEYAANFIRARSLNEVEVFAKRYEDLRTIEKIFGTLIEEKKQSGVSTDYLESDEIYRAIKKRLGQE